jgi:hypothetical protein
MKGCNQSETELSDDELGLLWLFVRSMDEPTVQTIFFVEVNGKYYLDQPALKEAGAQ